MCAGSGQKMGSVLIAILQSVQLLRLVQYVCMYMFSWAVLGCVCVAV